MGLFGDKPKISDREFHDACSGLYSKGFSSTQVNKVKEIFQGDINRSLPSEQGIDKNELARGISWMKSNKGVHGFSDKQIADIEGQLNKRL